MNPAETTLAPPMHQEGVGSLRAGEPLSDREFGAVRRRMMLDGCKWDPQVGDVGTLADFPVFISQAEWTRLAADAEQLSRELLEAELEIVEQPELLKRLGLPRPLRNALARNDSPLTPTLARVMRFDFHPTRTGWQISEVNSDVPGGYSEGSRFAAEMAARISGTRPVGNPGAAVTEAICARLKGRGGTIALLTAPGFMEDHQVVAYLARQLQALGVQTHLAQPAQLRWQDGYASLATNWFNGPVDAIVRFHQAEWLAGLPKACGWPHFFRGGFTPVMNPGIASISESKRFPLVCDALKMPMTTWRRLLPESCDPRSAPWQTDDGWLVKAAFSNTGDAVFSCAWKGQAEWTRTRWEARLFPGQWVAQRRFESLPLDTPLGPQHICLGVYTVDGRAAGAYVRLAPRPLIDFAAVDAALLVSEHDEGSHF